jgi:hydrogenase maturation protein HypF
MALTGRVRNNARGVLIDVEGDASNIEEFLRDLGTNPPPLSQIESIECQNDLSPADYQDFLILESASEGEKVLAVSADFATCDDCLRELFDPRDRRYRYPFINCTNCGPRFTLIEDVPYDRKNTTMRHFTMCTACRSEYYNPTDRRFHAEPTACPACGPQLELRNRFFSKVGGIADVIKHTQELVSDGKIVAIKGIGGFHLACDGLSSKAVELLRARKFRHDKPFALMARSLDIIREFCEVSNAEKELLLSGPRPIVLLNRKTSLPIPAAVAPGVNTLGFMLPYAPVHHLLLENLDRPMVMTSANVSDEPICFHDDDAFNRLAEIADYFLVHDRKIHIRTDDSVVRVHEERPIVLRRSRGYAPVPIKTGFEFRRPILACGAELKNTFCLARGHDAFVSHHIGDLENCETLKSFADGIQHFQRLFAIEPEVIAYDLHPEYLSTKYAQSLDHSQTKIGVQHHHAHIASCMVDNFVGGDVIGVAFDGLGFGLDGKFWGGEFLVANLETAERVAHLAYVPLPGGTKAIQEPWRMAAVYGHRAFGEDFHKLDLPLNGKLDLRQWKTLRSMITAGINSPESSSMGRLFDAVAGLLGLRYAVNYEGQAAIELESIAAESTSTWYEFAVEGNIINADGVIADLALDIIKGVPQPEISAKFHLAVAHMILSVAGRIAKDRKLNRIALSGGVFQNMFLLTKVCTLLRSAGFEVLTHRRVPPNDGGISLGQAAVANALLQPGRFN